MISNWGFIFPDYTQGILYSSLSNNGLHLVLFPLTFQSWGAPECDLFSFLQFVKKGLTQHPIVCYPSFKLLCAQSSMQQAQTEMEADAVWFTRRPKPDKTKWGPGYSKEKVRQNITQNNKSKRLRSPRQCYLRPNPHIRLNRSILVDSFSLFSLLIHLFMFYFCPAL